MQARKNSKIVILVDFHSELKYEKDQNCLISWSRHVNFILCNIFWLLSSIVFNIWSLIELTLNMKQSSVVIPILEVIFLLKLT